jgi:hypothetical protein
LLSLQEGSIPTADALHAQAAALLRSPAIFPRSRRVMQIVACALLPLAMPFSVLVAVRVQMQLQTANPQAFQLRACLQRLTALERSSELSAADIEQRDAIEIYIAERLRHVVEDSDAGSTATLSGIDSQNSRRALAQRAIARHPVRSPEQIDKADEVVAAMLLRESRGLAGLRRVTAQSAMAFFMWTISAAAVAVLAVIGAAVVPGGWTFRAFGAALVTEDGSLASRGRAVWRALLTWSPVAASLLLLRLGPRVQDATIGTALLQTTGVAVLLAGAAWALVHPSRGIQDRLARTWIVPR